MSKVKHLNDSNFETETAKGVVLVDFWAQWCGPCKMLSPILDQLADEIGDKAVIAKVDVDEGQKLATKFGVRSIPAIFIFKDGKVAQQFIGLQDKKTLLNAIDSAK